MKFLTLEVENFMALANAKVELDQRGLVLIQGVNAGDSSAASNGAGKSTLMNSLMWCIYGETSHGVKGDDVLSTGHEKNCRVKVTIEDEGKRYAIIRHRKHKEFKNRLIVRGEDGDMTKGKGPRRASRKRNMRQAGQDRSICGSGYSTQKRCWFFGIK